MKERKTEYDVVILAAGDFPTDVTAMRILRNAKHLIACDGAVEELLEMDILFQQRQRRNINTSSIPLRNKRITTLQKQQSMRCSISTFRALLHSAILVQQESGKTTPWAT